MENLSSAYFEVHKFASCLKSELIVIHAAKYELTFKRLVVVSFNDIFNLLWYSKRSEWHQ